MQTLDLRELEGLGRLQFNIKRSQSMGEGVRRSARKGRSAEFSGYREYMPGDDTRYVDWNAYARFDKLYIKEYMEEREGRIDVFLDTSRSMEFGSKLKSTLMAELTEVISYIGVNGKDSVYVSDMANPVNPFRVPSSLNGSAQLAKWLQKIECKGSVDINTSVRKMTRGRGGLTFIISDFMDEKFIEGLEDTLRLLNSRNITPVLLQILSEEEMNIDDIGAYQFIDSEDESKDVRLTLDRQTIRDYKSALQDYTRNIEKISKSGGAGYILCSTADSLQKIVYEKMDVLGYN